MIKIILTCILLVACSVTEAPPMAGTCVDRVAPNIFDGSAASIPFKVCEWHSRIWLCRLEPGAASWRCAVFTQTAPKAVAAPTPISPSE